MSDFCPSCGCDSFRKERTSLPEHLLDEYWHLLATDEETAHEFEEANTEEIYSCYTCGYYERD